jgi:hypothetical protein
MAGNIWKSSRSSLIIQALDLGPAPDCRESWPSWARVGLTRTRAFHRQLLRGFRQLVNVRRYEIFDLDRSFTLSVTHICTWLALNLSVDKSKQCEIYNVGLL